MQPAALAQDGVPVRARASRAQEGVRLACDSDHLQIALGRHQVERGDLELEEVHDGGGDLLERLREVQAGAHPLRDVDEERRDTRTHERENRASRGHTETVLPGEAPPVEPVLTSQATTRVLRPLAFAS